MNSGGAASLLSFYLGTGTDHMGRSLHYIVSQDNRWLENMHDYIQWLFPLYIRSRFNDRAPLLSDEARQPFVDPDYRDHRLLQENFSATIARMLRFYGYQVRASDSARIKRASDWEECSRNWLTRGNHNHLRMTRMLRCMTLLGRHPLARACRDRWLNASAGCPGSVSKETVEFWNEAVDTIPRDL